VSGVVCGMATGLLRVIPALVFFVALGVLAVRIVLLSRDLMNSDRRGERLFEVLFRLAASYIPAYLMFALVSDLPRQQDLKNLRPFLATQTAGLVGDGQAVLAALAEAAGHKVSDPPTQKDFDEICRSINPSGQAPFMKRYQPREYAT
jgi:hypothetical protein